MPYLTIKTGDEPCYDACREASDEQLLLMLRAIGADATPYRRYRDGIYYYATKNRAEKGKDDALWEDLVEKEDAVRTGDSYAVSLRGLWILRCRTGSTIYAYYDDPERTVMEVLALHELYDHCREFPMPITALAQNLYMNERQVAGIIHRYAALGYVEKHCHRGAHGWRITDKVKSCPECQKRYSERNEYEARVWADAKKNMEQNIPGVESADTLGVYFECIYGDMPEPRGQYLPRDIRGLGFTDEKIRELFPDMDRLLPGNWSSYGYRHGAFCLGLCLEPENGRMPDRYGPYTLQVSFADNDVVRISAR